MYIPLTPPAPVLALFPLIAKLLLLLDTLGRGVGDDDSYLDSIAALISLFLLIIGVSAVGKGIKKSWCPVRSGELVIYKKEEKKID